MEQRMTMLYVTLKLLTLYVPITIRRINIIEFGAHHSKSEFSEYIKGAKGRMSSVLGFFNRRGHEKDKDDVLLSLSYSSKSQNLTSKHRSQMQCIQIQSRSQAGGTQLVSGRNRSQNGLDNYSEWIGTILSGRHERLKRRK